MSAIFFLISLLGACGLIAELTDPRFIASPDHLNNLFVSGSWFGFWLILAIFMYQFEHKYDNETSSEPIHSGDEWWRTEHEKTNPKDALAETFADSGVYWDENGDRHSYRAYTRESGEVVTINDHIIAYGDIAPWGSKAEKK